MKNINMIRYTLAGVFVLFLSILLGGCVRDYGSIAEPEDEKNFTLHLNLDIPGLPIGTRAMSEAQENAIDYGSVQVLLFEEVPGGEIFSYNATITQQNPPTITVKVPAGKATENFRVVVIANMPPQTIAEATLKDMALGQYTFDCLGKWSTTAAIPMWGESATTFPITGDRDVNILMHRALARVDVGTLFKFNNPDPETGLEYENKDTDKESVWGLENFKVSDVFVYRTRDKAYAASSASKMSGSEVVTPNIPVSAQFNSNDGISIATLVEADENPLHYVVPDPGGVPGYVREVYIPESLVIDAQSGRNNVPCLVIGGYYGEDNTSKVTYYRADFADYDNGTVIEYRPILRNHRYVFDIRKVSGPGTDTPKEALEMVDANMILNIVDWDEVPLNYYVSEHFYFEINNRSVILDARAPDGASENSKTVSFSTDLILDGSTPEKSLAYDWETGGLFDVRIDYDARTITLIANSDNVGGGAVVRSDVLTLSTDNLRFTIYVSQLASNLEYTIDCASVQVAGKYAEGTEMNPGNYISLTVKSATELDGDYKIYTVPKNGIYFDASGTFSGGVYSGGFYEYAITLQAFGTVVNEEGVDPFISFNVGILSNSTNNSSCTAKIIVGYRTKKVLTIGANAVYQYGYMLEPNSASRAFVDAAINFGTNSDSRVIVTTNDSGNAFSIKVMTAGSGMIGEVIRYEELLNNLNTFQPDIILTGQAINYFTTGGNTNVIELLNRFVDEGGVFVMCNEYYPNTASITAMVSTVLGTPVDGNNQSIGNDLIFTLADGDSYADDIILNGPFGDMRGLQWGADGHELYGFNGLPSNMIVYSTRTDGRVCMFRHPDKGFFFMGEGGFLSNSGRYIGGAYQGSYVYFPFAIDNQYRPIPRTNYTPTRDQTVYNSQIFGNILTWAIDYSEKNGIAYQPGVDKF